MLRKLFRRSREDKDHELHAREQRTWFYTRTELLKGLLVGVEFNKHVYTRIEFVMRVTTYELSVNALILRVRCVLTRKVYADGHDPRTNKRADRTKPD